VPVIQRVFSNVLDEADDGDDDSEGRDPADYLP
jgi:hypothetical protein